MEAKIKRYFALCRPSTVIKFEFALKNWMIFLDDRYGEHGYANLAKATSDDVIDYYAIMCARKGRPGRDNPRDTLLAVRTVNAYFKALKAIHEMLVTESKLDRNVFKTKMLRLEHDSRRPKRETEAIPQHLVKRILENTKGTKALDQLQVMMAVMLAGALRISEALNLKIQDYFEDTDGLPNLILRETKAGCDVLHPFGKWAKSYMKRQLKIRLKDKAKKSENIFVTYYKSGKVKTKEFPIATAKHYIKQVLISHGLPRCSAHSFRKTHADALVNMDVHIEKVRQAMRHADIRTTQGYFSKLPARESAVNLFVPM